MKLILIGILIVVFVALVATMKNSSRISRMEEATKLKTRVKERE